ncbi:MAG TPA: hypothetical protein VK324_04740, partial [Tepidisphaeraceae bacterium]|nr:hypothetical protein [Tepidisphaeraceae bacterium]
GEGARALQEVPDDEGDGEPAAPGADAAVVTAVATAPAGEDVGTTAGDGESPANGNAVYRIDASGFVTEVFRQPVLVLSLVARNGTLLVGTGNEGFVYEVNPAADETVAVAKVDPKQVLSLLPARDGRIYLGLANVGGIAAMSSGFAPEGTYTSEAFDAGQISQFGKLQLHGALPDGAGLTVATRSGNVKDPEAGGWSKWSAELPATEFVPSAAPPARFFQYRLTLKAGAGARETPAVTDVDVAYAVPNLPPVVKSVKASLKAEEGGEPGTGGVAATPPGGRLREITWEASDPNADALQYAVSFRPLATAGPWVLLKDKLKETTYTWDTQSVADGRYQLRVVASDNAANPDGQGKTATRISDPVLVDNTPPLLSDVTTTVNGRDVRVELRAGDRNGIVSGAEYAVDSSQDWQAIAASDKLYDSPDEAASFVAKGLPPGAHVIAVRASDPMGNKGYVNVSVTIE